MLGKQLTQPIYLSVTGGKECFLPNGEQETALAAGSCNSMMITSGGVSEVVTSGKGPKVWWQYTTAAEFRSKEQIAAFAEKLEDQGCSGISVTVDIYVVSHRERSMHNGLVRRCCQVKGVPRNDKGEVVYQPEDVLWTSGDAPTAARLRPLLGIHSNA